MLHSGPDSAFELRAGWTPRIFLSNVQCVLSYLESSVYP